MTNQQEIVVQPAPARADLTDGSSLQALRQHRDEVLLRRNDIRVELTQMYERKAAAVSTGKVQFDRPIADLRHQEMAATLDIEATTDRIARLEKASQVQPAAVVSVARDPLIGRHQIEEAGYGAFLLMIPIVFALARRIWLRSSADARAGADLESSPRLRRMEEGIEAIALEVERIGEGQRFTAKLLSERLAESVAKRVTPPESPGARRNPGVITPH